MLPVDLQCSMKVTMSCLWIRYSVLCRFLSIPSMPSFMTRSGSPKPRRSPRRSPSNTPPVTPPVERKRTQSTGVMGANDSQDDFVMQLVAGASTGRRDSSRSVPGNISQSSTSTVPLQQVIKAMTGQGLGTRSSPAASEESSSSKPSRGYVDISVL